MNTQKKHIHWRSSFSKGVRSGQKRSFRKAILMKTVNSQKHVRKTVGEVFSSLQTGSSMGA